VDGTDAWIYNTITGQYSILDPNPDSTTNFSSQISYLAPNGVAVGEYKSGTETYEQAFVWSPLLGFEDLTSMTSMSDPNITQLTDAYSYNPATGQIFTTGQYVSGGNVETPGGGVAVLNGPIVPVPEPASVALVGGLAGIELLRRRRVS
jgi:hypothetical protein